jgi:hypothetical protein
MLNCKKNKNHGYLARFDIKLNSGGIFPLSNFLASYYYPRSCHPKENEEKKKG